MKRATAGWAAMKIPVCQAVTPMHGMFAIRHHRKVRRAIQRGVSKLRNRVIGRVFQELGLIEQWGSGIQRMTTACREQGLEDPVFEEVGTHFRATLSLLAERAPAMDARDER